MLKKRSIRIARHSTSISLEAEFWAELRAIAKKRCISLNKLVAEVDSKRSGNLSSSLRIYVLRELKAR
jgi:predicted DNA-binding ribbon-helix-helix protein